LDRPYTEPETVAALNLARLIEIYQPGDLRYHFEPEFAKKQLNQATQAQVKQLYNQFFAMNHAQIAMTGDFDAKKMQQFIAQSFGSWSSSQPYQKILSTDTDSCSKSHALSEQREFGNYQSILTFRWEWIIDAPALIVFTNILGQSQLSSRLGQEAS
jgi:zinc protease